MTLLRRSLPLPLERPLRASQHISSRLRFTLLCASPERSNLMLRIARLGIAASLLLAVWIAALQRLEVEPQRTVLLLVSQAGPADRKVGH